MRLFLYFLYLLLVGCTQSAYFEIPDNAFLTPETQAEPPAWRVTLGSGTVSRVYLLRDLEKKVVNSDVDVSANDNGFVDLSLGFIEHFDLHIGRHAFGAKGEFLADPEKPFERGYRLGVDLSAGTSKMSSDGVDYSSEAKAEYLIFQLLPGFRTSEAALLYGNIGYTRFKGSAMATQKPLLQGTTTNLENSVDNGQILKILAGFELRSVHFVWLVEGGTAEVFIPGYKSFNHPVLGTTIGFAF